jgi:hypothetical protein
MSLIADIKKNLINIPGWRTKRKLFVIESDDWGSIATPDLKTYEFLVSKGLPLDKSHFAKYDSLEGADDLTHLFEVLHSVKDKNNKPACLTACSVVANPDFERIKESNLHKYFFESALETYKKNIHTEKSPELIKQGIKEGVYYPQLHGREHLNPLEWLKQINNNDLERLAFNHKTLPVLPNPISSSRKLGYLSAFDYEDIVEFNGFEQVLNNAAQLFQDQFGFSSISFMAPTSVRSEKMNVFLKNIGVDYHHSGNFTTPKYEGYQIKNYFWGHKSKENQIHWRRNILFEPSSHLKSSWVQSALKDIDVAFRWGKPAVLSSHRVNFIGSIHEKNRIKGLNQLSDILHEVVVRYPEVEFVTSEQLGKIIFNGQ